MIRRIFLACVILIVSDVAGYAEDYAELEQRADDYWRQIQQITSKEFGGWNVEVSVHTSYNFEETTTSGRGVGVGLSMPIYSKKDRIESRLKAMQFSEHGSELIMKFRESIAHGEIIGKECKYKQSIMSEYGVAAIDSYYECKRKFATQRLVMEQKERDIRSLIDPYLKKSNQAEVLKTGGQ